MAASSCRQSDHVVLIPAGWPNTQHLGQKGESRSISAPTIKEKNPESISRGAGCNHLPHMAAQPLADHLNQGGGQACSTEHWVACLDQRPTCPSGGTDMGQKLHRHPPAHTAQCPNSNTPRCSGKTRETVYPTPRHLSQRVGKGG